jgi:drug/metabolite transporter (DMT)-like permease
MIGTNRAMPLQSIYILVSAVLGISFFAEPITFSLALALVLVTGALVWATLRLAQH